MKKNNKSNNPITVEQLVELRKYLPRGAVAQLARMHNYKMPYVTMILNGDKINTKVVESAINIALAEKERSEKEREKIQSKLKKLTA